MHLNLGTTMSFYAAPLLLTYPLQYNQHDTIYTNTKIIYSNPNILKKTIFVVV